MFEMGCNYGLVEFFVLLCAIKFNSACKAELKHLPELFAAHNPLIYILTVLVVSYPFNCSQQICSFTMYVQNGSMEDNVKCYFHFFSTPLTIAP